ncbi:hypothetical protein ACMYSK_23735 [Klebsiella sp. I138]|uniref:hypothetical protein n=1 Tax=Klebsiella sp. I138 TaxID=2755385 RepID=UPI003DA7C04C
MPVSLYLYSEDLYFSLGVKTLCEKQEVNFHSLDQNVNANLNCSYDNDILLIDAESILLENYDAIFKISELFEHKFITFDRYSPGGLHEWYEREDRYISKKITSTCLDLILHKKIRPKKVFLTLQESILLDDLIKENTPCFVSNFRGISIKNIYQKRKRILDKCGFDIHTPRNVLNSYLLYRMHGS